MAEAAEIPEVQGVEDEDQWLYGDEKDENQEEGEIDDKAGDDDTEETSKENGQDAGKEKEDNMEEGGEEGDKDDTEKTAEKEKDASEDKPADEDDGEDSDDDSDEDGMAITIGPLKKQTDVIQAPAAHAAKFQPKAAPTAGLKDEDFTAVGKINGVPVTEFRIDDFEDKPWRKPGADLSDYFNYGFNEETWFKYCERQKQMRMSESGAGLGGLGIGVNANKPNYQPFTNNTSIPVSIVNDNSKYHGIPPSRKFAGPPPRAFNKDRGSIDVLGSSGNKSAGNTITVMTADRREYSNKIVGNQNQSSYDDNMDFGGNPYGDAYVPPPDTGMYYGGPPGPFNNQGGWTGGDWDHSGPPPGMPPGPPPIMPPVSGPPGYFNNEDSMGAHSTGDRRSPVDDRQRSRRSGRSRSRSPSRRHREDRDRDRHRSQSHRSRSRSPSHRHKRKKSKREREAD